MTSEMERWIDAEIPDSAGRDPIFCSSIVAKAKRSCARKAFLKLLEVLEAALKQFSAPVPEIFGFIEAVETARKWCGVHGKKDSSE